MYDFGRLNPHIMCGAGGRLSLIQRFEPLFFEGGFPDSGKTVYVCCSQIASWLQKPSDIVVVDNQNDFKALMLRKVEEVFLHTGDGTCQRRHCLEEVQKMYLTGVAILEHGNET